MARPRRTGRILKRAGLALSLIIVVQWGLSQFWAWGYLETTSFPFTVCGIGDGSLVYANLIGPAPRFSGWFVRESTEDMNWKPQWEGNPGLRVITLPLWIPFALTLLVFFVLPKAFLRWRERYRIPLHCCQKCGYDLTGNVSGICPECGEKIQVKRGI